VPENEVHDIHYGEECIMRRYQLSMSRIICVRGKNDQDQGHFGNYAQEVYKDVRVGKLHFSHVFLSLS